jgi:transcriptional regulator with XRE-family HTH domain
MVSFGSICLLASWASAQKLSGVTPLERFAANLKALRAERGWSQEDLSRASGLHTTAISKMEGANRAPRFPTIVTLAKALEVPAARLFDRIP